MNIKKKIPLIDQHDKYGFWGGKFGGNFIPETLKKPIDDLTKLFAKLRKADQIRKNFPRDFNVFTGYGHNNLQSEGE